MYFSFGYDKIHPEINRLRCRVNNHALKFLPEIQQMADLLAARMRNRIGRSNPYMALHLRFEKGMVGLSFCYFLGTREEKASMAENRKRNGHGGISISAEWFSSVATSPAEAKGRRQCPPLEPGEVAVILYVASGQVYGGKNRMAPLRNIFPNGERNSRIFSEEYGSTGDL
ncbi:GDP-fucose protein O-fucosyltransferase [Parasponia andersonii]|uniref:O-fucosyltransferase family protein n=1 Tax=Parasponia andersonii TaxID=3476 RepID=A0A2P5AV70_PARAD|nr:GDP-fucose protein O-fucosyltransferase [Parasponia andersonii]